MDRTQALRWRREAYDGEANLAMEKPRYQLILGDLHQVPAAIQEAQSIDGFVGRLAFTDLSGAVNEAAYEAYVDKILKWERRQVQQSRLQAQFFTVHDGTAAIHQGFTTLIQPGLELLRRRVGPPTVDATQVGDESMPSPNEFMKIASTEDPRAFFSLSHGLGAPRLGWRSTVQQHECQGAISFGGEGFLRGADVQQGPFLPGSVWFMLACFSAGTPVRSSYSHWLERLRDAGRFDGPVGLVLRSLPKAGERPFISALPQAALANPDGPLAFIGHLDLAWTYSFSELDWDTTRKRPQRYMDLVNKLLIKDRVGIAFNEICRYVAVADAELAAHYESISMAQLMGKSTNRETENSVMHSHLWMLRNDLAGYILLGDPAVRLPITTMPHFEAMNKDSLDLSIFTSLIEKEKKSVFPLETWEEAICNVIIGERGVKAIARDYQINWDELRELAEHYRQAGRAALLAHPKVRGHGPHG